MMFSDLGSSGSKTLVLINLFALQEDVDSFLKDVLDIFDRQARIFFPHFLGSNQSSVII